MDANQTLLSREDLHDVEAKFDTEDTLDKDQQQYTENEFFKHKYRDLKKTLKTVVTKNEYLKSELKINQKKLQLVEEDKFFLLERLLVYEKPPESPQPTPDLSDSDQEGSTPGKKVKMQSTHPGGVTFSSAFSKLKPITGLKRHKKNKKIKTFGEFLDSPSGFGSLDDDDSSSYAMGGPGGLQTFQPHEDDDSD